MYDAPLKCSPFSRTRDGSLNPSKMACSCSSVGLRGHVTQLEEEEEKEEEDKEDKEEVGEDEEEEEEEGGGGGRRRGRRRSKYV